MLQNSCTAVLMSYADPCIPLCSGDARSHTNVGVLLQVDRAGDLHVPRLKLRGLLTETQSLRHMAHA